jgi:putative oxidoreductase
MRSSVGAETANDAVLLVARILLVLLFVIFGWQKLTGFEATIAYFAKDGVPLPRLAAAIAVTMEFFVGVAIALGFATRPLALLLAFYTLATAILGHHFWNMSGAARMANEINFLKNASIIGGFLLLYVTGAGRYSLDSKISGR